MAALNNKPYLEKKITRENTGNLEIITKSTADMALSLKQVDEVCTLLAENLRGIHRHMRVPKKILQIVSKKETDAGLAWIGDWVVSVRARYRDPFFAFGTATQNRVTVDKTDS